MEGTVLDRLTPVFRAVFDDESLEIRREMTAADVEGWDSISHIELIVAIEKEFGIRFKSLDLEKLQSVGDLADLIEKKLATAA